MKNIQVRKSSDRGHANHGWLDSYHTFSFADYFDPQFMGYRSLRVINEDRVEAKQGFGTHPHRDMEILTYVISGQLAHKDSMGSGSTIRPGQVQKMTAGTGITHSEFNASDKEAVHLLQIWIVPHLRGLKPSYEEYTLAPPDEKNPLLLIGSLDGGKNIVKFNQDVLLYRGILSSGQSLGYSMKPGRGVWVQMVKGQLAVNDVSLSAGDGAAIEKLAQLSFQVVQPSEFLLFDLA